MIFSGWDNPTWACLKIWQPNSYGLRTAIVTVYVWCNLFETNHRDTSSCTGGGTAELSKKFTSSNRIIYIPLFSVAHLDCNYTIYTCVLIICLDHLCWSFWGITTFFGISLIQFPLVHGGDFIPVWFGNSCSTYHISVYWLSFFQTLINTVGWFIWRIVTKATINHHC